MAKLYTIVFLFLIFWMPAQSQTDIPAFGKVSAEDFELKECPFEKDANAMVLFDKGEAFFVAGYGIMLKRHKRIKIFNEKGKQAANIRLEYVSRNQYEKVIRLQAQTINMVDGKTEIIKIEKNSFYTETIDRNKTAIVFTFPQVQEGSIVEFTYEWGTQGLANFPEWFFQGNLPARYSEIKTTIPFLFSYRPIFRINRPLLKDDVNFVNGMGVVSVRAMANIPTLLDEPFMTSKRDNLQHLAFQLTRINKGYSESFLDTWHKVGDYLAEDEDFGGQLKRKLEGEEAIISKMASLKSDEEKIAYIFNEVKHSMKWNNIDRWYTSDGTAKAWEKKIGNSTEINLILYHLLKKAGINAYPMVVSTREHGKVRRENPSLTPFNRTVAFIPGSKKTGFYVLDATDKFHSYTTVPFELLNSNGLSIDKENKRFHLIFISMEKSMKNIISVNAEVLSEGKMRGDVAIMGSGYFKETSLRSFNYVGENKYKELLKGNDPNLSLATLTLFDAEIDTLPLKQLINFEARLPEGENNYLYFSPNVFGALKENPFTAEKRATDIDFGYKNSYIISGSFTVPAGYKVEALPKSINMVTPDKGISFKRVAAEQDGMIQIRYNVDFNKTVFFKEDYPDFREFYKEMHEMLNEQVVLKKI